MAKMRTVLECGSFQCAERLDVVVVLHGVLSRTPASPATCALPFDLAESCYLFDRDHLDAVRACKGIAVVAPSHGPCVVIGLDELANDADGLLIR
jgi:hypothetical protein